MYKNILSSFNTPITVLDKDNLIIFVNPAFEEFFSKSQKILLNNNLIDFVDEDSSLFLLINRVRKFNNSLSEDSLVLSSKFFKKRKLKVNVFPIYGFDDHIALQFSESLVSEKFITHKIHNKVSKSFSSLIEMLMHELKNPLSGIVGASQLLFKSLKNKENKELADLIQVEAKRINKLLSNVENISTGDTHLISDYVNIHEVLNHCKKIAKNSFGKEIIFYEKYDPSLPKVYGNRDLLIQIFVNLIKNACEAQPDSGKIILKTSFQSVKSLSFNTDDRPEQLPLQVEIIDYGVGIEEKNIINIFEPFVSTKKSGKGLGLSLVYSGLSAMNASIEVNSKVGETNFIINFPLLENSEIKIG